MIAAKGQTMPRKKKVPGATPPKPRDATTVKIDSELHHKARMVALARRIELYEYLDEIIRQTIDHDHKQIIRG